MHPKAFGAALLALAAAATAFAAEAPADPDPRIEAPWIVRGITQLDAALIRTLLGPTDADQRIQSLEETRTIAVDESAAALRRIERDLHDGAQARLVGLAMNLGIVKDELDGSEWAHVVHGHLGGVPPQVDLDAERSLGALLADASRDSLVTSAHDLSEGGLAQALVEASFRHGIGISVSLADVAADAFVALFSESAARAIVTVTTDRLEAFSTAAAAHGVLVTRLGTTGGDSLVVEGAFELPVAEARAAWSATLPEALA